MKCLCGCGTEIPERDKGGKLRLGYAHNHHRRGKSNHWLVKPAAEVDEFTCRRRARRLKSDVTVCEWSSIGSCQGPLEVAHVDGNPWNGEKTNLLKLCASHHRLLDSGRIDPTNPEMPPFRVGADGKRRYLAEERREGV